MTFEKFTKVVSERHTIDVHSETYGSWSIYDTIQQKPVSPFAVRWMV